MFDLDVVLWSLDYERLLDIHHASFKVRNAPAFELVRRFTYRSLPISSAGISFYR